MAFVTQEDILSTFEGLTRYLFKEIKGLDFPTVPRMTYADAMRDYGNDKPDTRFEMKFVDLTSTVQGQGFPVFDQAEIVLGINAMSCALHPQAARRADRVCEAPANRRHRPRICPRGSRRPGEIVG
jgi:aspartyl-tRNA synthetase